MALKSSNKVDTNVYEIEVTVAPEEFTQACKDAYLKRRKSIQLPGFRKGKATQGMIEKLYGEGFFYEDALEIVYPAVVTAAIEEAGLRTVDSPAELDVKTISKSEGVDMTMKVTVYPEVKLGQYKGLEAVRHRGSNPLSTTRLPNGRTQVRSFSVSSCRCRPSAVFGGG